MLSLNQERQLSQLSRLSPELYARTAEAIRLAPKSAGRIISRALAGFDGLPANLEARVTATINRLNTAGIAPGGKLLVYQSRSLRVYLRRRRDLDDLSLYVTGRVVRTTKRIAYLGRDWDHISGPAYKWKLDEKAGERISQLLNEVQ